MWLDDSDGDREIYLYDGATTTQITHNDTHDTNVRLFGDGMVYLNREGANETMRYTDGTTITDIRTDTLLSMAITGVSEDCFVWHRYFPLDNTSGEIFVTQGFCLAGDVSCDEFVEISADIIPAFTNFTGPGSFNVGRAEGDVHSNVIGATTAMQTLSSRSEERHRANIRETFGERSPDIPERTTARQTPNKRPTSAEQVADKRRTNSQHLQENNISLLVFLTLPL